MHIRQTYREKIDQAIFLAKKEDAIPQVTGLGRAEQSYVLQLQYRAACLIRYIHNTPDANHKAEIKELNALKWALRTLQDCHRKAPDES